MSSCFFAVVYCTVRRSPLERNLPRSPILPLRELRRGSEVLVYVAVLIPVVLVKLPVPVSVALVPLERKRWRPLYLVGTRKYSFSVSMPACLR